jgi:cation-transporting P-type ATPase E
VANLFLTKTFYALILVLLVGVASLPFPFLPRHLTLIGSLTIGIPAFFLALAPNADRARSGFVRRVITFAIPAGLVVAVASFASYGLARVNTSSELGSDQTAAVITLFIVTAYVLLLVARPLVWWKVILVTAMVLIFAIVITVPGLQSFFALEPGEIDNDLIAVAAGLLGCVLLHVVLVLAGSMPGHRRTAHRVTTRA